MAGSQPTQDKGIAVRCHGVTKKYAPAKQQPGTPWARYRGAPQRTAHAGWPFRRRKDHSDPRGGRRLFAIS